MIELYARPSSRTLKLVKGEAQRNHFIDHAYKCKPFLEVNRFGWDLIADEEIVGEDRQPTRVPGYLQLGINASSGGSFSDWVTSLIIAFLVSVRRYVHGVYPA